MARTAVASRKYLQLAVLLVFLSYPHYCDAFGFQFGGGDDSADDAAASSGKQLAKRRAIVDKKFKFRKIERVYVDKNNANDGGNGDGDNDDDDGDAASAADNAASDNSRLNEDEEFQFQRARKADKQRQQRSTPDAKGRKRAAAAVAGTASVNERDDSDDSDETRTESGSLLGSLFGGWFAGDKSAEANSAEKEEEEEEAHSNGIIDWLKWLGEKTGHLSAPPPPPPPSMLAGWLSYLDRWPFNSLFPFAKTPQRPIRVPRHAATTSGGGGGGASHSAGQSSAEAAPISEERFESLLHTLPGFVVNADRVADAECRQQMQIFNRQLRGNKLWTLQMLDATGKISAGLLRGNINQFGDFDMCTQIRTLVKVTPDIPLRIRGKYCLAHIETQAIEPALKVAVHLAHGRGLWNSHLGNPSHFVARYAVANWGVCVPHMCSGQVVQAMLEDNLRPYNLSGVEFNVEVDDDDCYMRQSKRLGKLLRQEGKFGLTIGVISTLVLLLLATLLHEYWSPLAHFARAQLRLFKGAAATETENDAGDAPAADAAESDEPEKDVQQADSVEESAPADETATEEPMKATSLKLFARELFESFSPRSTLAVLMARDATLDQEHPVFHVLKLSATLMLYVCLKYLMIGHLPVANRDQLVRSVSQPLSIVFRAPLIYADVLLLISGFLSARQLSEEMEERNFIQVLKRMAAKMTRYLPTVYVVLCFQTWILPHLGAGPQWSNLVGQNARICEQQMWRNVFSAQNAIDLEDTCSPMTIQLALEVQLYLLGPLIVWLYYTDADAGFFAYGAIHAMSVAARYSRTSREHLSTTLFHGMNVSKFYRTANMLFASPISRATPYLLGIGAGLLHRSQNGCLDVAPELVPVGWTLALLSVLWCFWSPSSGMRADFIYTASDAASYAAWSPLILGLALCWLVFMFPKSDRPLMRLLTQSRAVLFLSRIAFPIQLAMYVVVMYNTASVKESHKYHLTDMINFQEIATIVLVATALAFIVDIPAQRVRRLVVNRLFAERATSAEHDHDQEPISGAEQSEEAEASEEHSEKAASSTPEPPDTVWASDAEEEEQKYLTRRRSSTVAVNNDAAKPDENAEAEKDDEEEEEETDIAEEDEVKKRPDTPEPPAKPKVEEQPQPSYTRRRRPPTSDD